MRRNRTAALPFLVVPASTVNAPRDDRAAMLASIDAKRESYAAVAKQIWPSPKSAIRSRRATNLERVGGFAYTPEEIGFAEAIRKILTHPPDVAIGSQEKVPTRIGAINSSSRSGGREPNVPTVSMTGATFVPACRHTAGRRPRAPAARSASRA